MPFSTTYDDSATKLVMGACCSVQGEVLEASKKPYFHVLVLFGIQYCRKFSAHLFGRFTELFVTCGSHGPRMSDRGWVIFLRLRIPSSNIPNHIQAVVSSKSLLRTKQIFYVSQLVF